MEGLGEQIPFLDLSIYLHQLNAVRLKLSSEPVVFDGVPLRPWSHPRILQLGESQRSGVIFVNLDVHLRQLSRWHVDCRRNPLNGSDDRKRERQHWPSATYSASSIDVDISVCSLDTQTTGQSETQITNPVWLRVQIGS